MRRANSLFLLIQLLAVLPLATNGWAASEKVLYSFQGGADGGTPYDYGLLVRDSAGNLYGTTGAHGNCGGDYAYGTIFQVSADGTETVLHNFCNADGADPYGGLIRDAQGNFYGTTAYGGSGEAGTVFELSGSTLTTLHSFTGSRDGTYPQAGVVRDSSGNLYGTTLSGGYANGAGVVYEVSSSGKFSVLYRFCPTGGCPDGAEPFGGLAIDQQGNLYGTTVYGGARDYGTVYELSPRSGGGWKYSVLHSFARSDGSFPFGGLTLSTQKLGNKQQTVILGTASYGGGPANAGTVFEMSKSRNGYKLTVLHRFINAYGDGANPQGTLTIVNGKIFGTTVNGGKGSHEFIGGTVFELIHGRTWTEKILYTFTGGSDGNAPYSGVVLDPEGKLYGAGQSGGNSYGSGSGVVYEVTP